MTDCGPASLVGFPLTTPPCLSQKLFHLFVVPHLELLGAKLEFVQPLCPPEVVHGGDTGQVGPRLFVEQLERVAQVSHFPVAFLNRK